MDQSRYFQDSSIWLICTGLTQFFTDSRGDNFFFGNRLLQRYPDIPLALYYALQDFFNFSNYNGKCFFIIPKIHQTTVMIYFCETTVSLDNSLPTLMMLYSMKSQINEIIKRYWKRFKKISVYNNNKHCQRCTYSRKQTKINCLIAIKHNTWESWNLVKSDILNSMKFEQSQAKSCSFPYSILFHEVFRLRNKFMSFLSLGFRWNY